MSRLWNWHGALALRRLPGRLYASLKHRMQDPVHMLTRFCQATLHGRALDPIQDNTSHIVRGDILLFACLRNEAVRIPYFLDYYRHAGVDHFLFVDNGSTDGFRDLVRDAADVSVWYTDASYRNANFGMHWLNHLLRRHGCDHWCVTCDPDEFLVHPHDDTRNLRELAAFLESEGRRSLCCVMLDMYGERPVEQTHYAPGDNPFSIAPCFDATGYVRRQGWLNDHYTQGGVRRRVFFNDVPGQSPALNKTPFVKWRWSYSYFLSMHQLVPGWLNLAHFGGHSSPTGCIMHFKYFSVLNEKVAEELQRKEHWDDSYEYRRYHDHLHGDRQVLTYEGSVAYENWRQLEELGLLNRGQWF